jgi:hypothetical protein
MLTKYLEKAAKAFMNVSFSPEKRGEQTVKWYSEELESDLKELMKTKGTVGNYAEKYEEHFLHWLSAQSRCFSFLITGSGNFPVARHAKTLNAERSAYEKFRAWREGYFKAVNRKRTLSPEEEIDATIIRLDELTAKQEMMKGVNKIFRNKKTSIEEKLNIIGEEYGEDAIKAVIDEMEYEARYNREFCGFASFSLTNNNAKIKAMTQKIEVMKKRIARKESFEPIKFDGGHIDIQADRVIIKHDEKPSHTVINELKSRGFRWSGQYASWSRKHTENAIYDAKRICGVN